MDYYCLSHKTQRDISTFVMYYSKIHQEVDALIKALTEWSLTRTVIQKSGRGCLRERSLTRAFQYRV